MIGTWRATALTMVAALSLALPAQAAGSQAAGSQAAGPMPPPAYQSMARDILKELVEINSVHAKGSTVAAQAIAAAPWPPASPPGTSPSWRRPTTPPRAMSSFACTARGSASPCF